MVSRSSSARRGGSRRATPKSRSATPGSSATPGPGDVASGSSSVAVPATDLPSTESSTARRGVGHRGPTTARYLTGLRERLPLQWVGHNYVGPHHKDASTWIGQIVRNEAVAPLVGIKGWKKIDEMYKEKMYQKFLEKFEWPSMDTDTHRADVLLKMKERYRNYRHDLHEAYGCLVGAPAEQLVATSTERDGAPSLHVLQWLVSYWASPEFKAKSERGKSNRAASTTPAPLMGRTSMPQLFHRMTQTLGHEPTRIDLFETSRRRPDGSYKDDRVSAQVEQMRQMVSDSGEGSSSSQTTVDSAIDAVLGAPAHGRVLCTGLGVTPSAYFGREGMRSRRGQTQIGEISHLRQQLDQEREAREALERTVRETQERERESREAFERTVRETQERERESREAFEHRLQEALQRQMQEWMSRTSGGS